MCVFLSLQNSIAMALVGGTYVLAKDHVVFSLLKQLASTEKGLEGVAELSKGMSRKIAIIWSMLEQVHGIAISTVLVSMYNELLDLLHEAQDCYHCLVV